MTIAAGQLDARINTARQAIIDLLLKQGLYSSLDVSTDEGKTALDLVDKSNIGVFDCFCIGCKRETPFIVAPIDIPSRGGGLRTGRLDIVHLPPPLIALKAVCQRDRTVYQYVLSNSGQKLTKIGQTPSLATISFGELSHIDQSLPAEDRKELGQALGLFAHDAIIGAFAYLRRVFERMISRAHERKCATGQPVDDFHALKVDQRINALRDELPEMLVRNSRVFSVLSLGLHELPEETCKQVFPVMKSMILLMLREEEQQRKTAAATAEAERELQALLSSGIGQVSGEVRAAPPAKARITGNAKKRDGQASN